LKNRDTKLFYTIKEVSELLEIKPHILRYWDREFPFLSPKRKRGRRLYTFEDIRSIIVIKYLLKSRGYSIKGVKRRFEEEGIQSLLEEVKDDIITQLIEEIENIQDKLAELVRKLQK